MFESMVFGLDYTTSLGDSDHLQELLDLDPDVTPTVQHGAKAVGALAMHTAMQFGRFIFIGEYILALDKFRTDDFDLDGAGTGTLSRREPSALRHAYGYVPICPCCWASRRAWSS